jgi:FAD:protein FMN transferase
VNGRADTAPWRRRARPLLGTLVEIGVLERDRAEQAWWDAAFAAIREAQSSLSRFEPDSDLARFHALPRAESLTVRPVTRQVLAAARELQVASAGVFDISLGSGPDGWRLVGDELQKLSDEVRLDLGGIGKGHAVDLAIQALIEQGCTAGWVNAGGDLRAFGGAEVPIHLRDEDRGGARPFAVLRDGAFATSALGPGRGSQLAVHGGTDPRVVHVSVTAPLCLWADALTKIVAASGDATHPLLAGYEARAWLHRAGE